jgi:hypothetical protein
MGQHKPRWISRVLNDITACMRVGVQKQQMLLVTTEGVFLRYDKAFLFTNQSEVDFGITLI